MKVIFLSLDTLRADRLSCLGNSRGLTPNLDRLAAESTLFTNAYATDIPTQPSHTALFTGRYGLNTGIVSHFHPPSQLDESISWLPAILRDAGCATGAVDHLFAMKDWFVRGYDDYMPPPGRSRSPGSVINDIGFRWLDDHATDDFYLFLHYWDAHIPYVPPPTFKERFTAESASVRDPLIGQKLRSRPSYPLFKRNNYDHLGDIPNLEYIADLYDAEVAYLDHELGRLVDHLEELGILDETMIVIFGDHGEVMTEHDSWFDHAGLYDSVTHVPLMIRAPGLVPAGRVTEMVALIDVMPTVLSLLGLPPVDGIDGRSLVPLINGSDQPHRPEIMLSEATWQATRGVRTADWKFIRCYDPGVYPRVGDELYRLSEDPDEQVNVADQHPEVVAELGAVLDAWLEQQLAGRRDPLLDVMEHGLPAVARLDGIINGTTPAPPQSGEAVDAALLGVGNAASYSYIGSNELFPVGVAATEVAAADLVTPGSNEPAATSGSAGSGRHLANGTSNGVKANGTGHGMQSNGTGHGMQSNGTSNGVRANGTARVNGTAQAAANGSANGAKANGVSANGSANGAKANGPARVNGTAKAAANGSAHGAKTPVGAVVATAAGSAASLSTAAARGTNGTTDASGTVTGEPTVTDTGPPTAEQPAVKQAPPTVAAPADEDLAALQRSRQVRSMFVAAVVLLAVAVLIIAVYSVFLKSSVQAAGVVQPSTTSNLDLAANGPITAVDVTPGQLVEKGQVLAKEDPSNAQARLAADQSKVSAEFAKQLADQAALSGLEAPTSAATQAQLQAAVTTAQASYQAAVDKVSQVTAQQSADVQAAQQKQTADQSVLANDQQTENADAPQCLKPNPPAQCASDARTVTSDQAQVNTDQAAVAEAQATQTAQIAEAQQAAAVAQSQVQKAQADATAGTQGATPQEMADAQGAVSTDQATLSAYKAQVVTDQRAMANTVLRAPFRCVVGSVNGAVGDMETSQGVRQSPAGSLVTQPQSSGISIFPQAPQQPTKSQSSYAPLITCDSVTNQVVAQVPETSINSIHLGEAAHVTLPAVPGSSFNATVSNINPTAVTDNGNAYFLVQLSVKGQSLNPPAHGHLSRAAVTAAERLVGQTANVSF